jgi:hypothetical protein
MLAIGALGAIFESVVLARHACYAYKNAEHHASEASFHHSAQDRGSLLNVYRNGTTVDSEI